MASVEAVVVGVDGEHWLAELTFDPKKAGDVVVRERPDNLTAQRCVDPHTRDDVEWRIVSRRGALATMAFGR